MALNVSNSSGHVTDPHNHTWSNSSGIVKNLNEHKWSLEFSVILAIVLSISALFTIMGNSMVLMVIIRHRGMRTRTNLFLVNLAVADLLVGLFVLPFTIATLIANDWIFGEIMCLLNGWMNSFCLVTSFHTLMYISIHKYYSIVRPLGNPLKLTYIIAMMAAAWFWAAVCSTLNITILHVTHKHGTSQCGPNYPDNIKMFIIHGVLQLTVIVLPAIILVFCYVRMFMEIRKHSQRLRTNSTVEEDFILSQQKKVAVTLFIVLATFIMMALPYHAYATYVTIKKDKEHFSNYINPLAYMFLYLSSMCNPIIYAFRSPAFRQGYKEILCHTRNYVISDDSEMTTRTRRLSSLISTLRRSSTAECRHSMHYIDSRVLNMHTPELDKFKSAKQKSLFKLLRSTRQSTAQSVVHRNGDIIIMKGGKIVSVRRAGEGREGSPLLDRLKTLKDTTQGGMDFVSGLAGPGHVMFGLVCDGLVDDEEEDLMRKNDKDNVSYGSDDVFSQVGINKTKAHSQIINTGQTVLNVKENGTGQSVTNNLSKVKKTVRGDHVNFDSVQLENDDASDGVKFPVISANFSSNKLEKSPCSKNVAMDIYSTNSSDNMIREENNKNNLPYLQKSAGNKSDVSGGPVYPGGKGIVIHVDDEDDILSVMPLTPFTRECLAKSDWHVALHNSKTPQSHAIPRGMHGSLSSENLFKKPPAIQRQISLEFIDSPIQLFKSKSNMSITSLSKKRKEEYKSPIKTNPSGSPESKSSSKSLCLRSPFSSKKKGTQV